MAKAMFYRPGPKWHVCAAFCGAVLIHAGAVALAAMSAAPPPPEPVDVDVVDVFVVTDDPEPAQLIEPAVDIPAPPPPPQTESAFTDEAATPPPVPRRISQPPQRVVKAAPTAARMSFGAAKVFAISAPRPEYPYEARRQRATGSGVASLTIDVATGVVTDVRMVRSTGNPVLDNATISGLRRWRFKPGTVSAVQTPITYTLTGAAF